METNYVYLVLVSIIAAIIGSSATYYFTIKSKKSEAMLKFKEEKYVNLLILLQGFTAAKFSTDTQRKFFEEQYKSWLYCSDDVVKAINNMIQIVSKDKKPASGDKGPAVQKGRDAIGNIVLAMRKDLLGKTKLNHNDFQYTNVIEGK